MEKPGFLWEPDEAFISNSNLKAFADHIGKSLLPYEHFHRWSFAKPKEFWSAVWDFANIIGEKGDGVLSRPEDGCMQGTSWFPYAKLNFAENLLRGDEKRIAIVEGDENGEYRCMSMGELRRLVAQVQTGLRSLGINRGDRVAGIVTNRIEGLAALLATASLGAVWTSCSPDFGPQGIVDRIGQVKPKVIIATLDYQYNEKTFDMGAPISTVCDSIDGLSTLVTIGNSSGLSNVNDFKIITWEELCDNDSSSPEFIRVSFKSPLYILYSSGTTGLPKAIVHSVGGTLIQHLKEHKFHCDIKPGDVMFWYTNTAWMMYHWLVSGLASEATIFLYDGAPVLKNEPGMLWRYAEGLRITHFGLSPKYLEVLMKQTYPVNLKHDLPQLRSVLSAGAPVSPEQFHWVYENIKQDMMFSSISGGTEIIGCFVMGSPVHPVRAGEISCKALGMAVDVLDDRGASVIHQKGDLVCTQPFPSMPITFWGEDGEKRYKNTYFVDRPGIWTHGDLAEQTNHGSIIIYGRVDGTLKPGGVRIGTAEIYRVIDQIPEIQDSIVFGLPNNGDEEIVLCVVTKDRNLDIDTAKSMRYKIRSNASPRHVPHRIYCVNEIPYTLNGKKVEGAVKSTVLGKSIKNHASIINPECLAEYSILLGREFK
ncbi:acetoacetate--CoA ligase [Bacillus sp. FJAT-49705]|uniref:Acetoacetate--CoA ligase n=1 Tax=Cytobacillus citreus TaxID=2833586 RepID=A0ABS5NPU3_9BACI|nr:acetoacetate--CoA ligase [Cytobacillus citreus]MBS4189479.1 acetoacetate--CoA ligase [Cytobacillus citreus]